MFELIDGDAPDGQYIVSVLVAHHYRVERGQCHALPAAELQQEVVYYEQDEIDHRGPTRPSLVKRDLDHFGWRSFSDVVVQGDVIAPSPSRSLDVTLSCRGSAVNWEQTIAVSGDRQVERGRTGLRLSEAQPFERMPLRYDKAYGGSDDGAEEAIYGSEMRRQMIRCLGEAEALELGMFSYPRNPAGKGYVVREESAVGTPWPNLELRGEQLDLSQLVRPHEQWGERPFPAAYDWFTHSWYPRSRDISPLPETADGLMPRRERELGMTTGVPHSLAQGAHPYLCRTRLRGDERLAISHMASDGNSFAAQLPGRVPAIALGLAGAQPTALHPVLDLVFVEPGRSCVTLVWRGTAFGRPEHMPVDWADHATCVVS